MRDNRKLFCLYATSMVIVGLSFISCGSPQENKIGGQTQIADQNSRTVKRKKFVPKYTFEDFPAENVFDGTPVQIDYNSHKLAREFKTVMTSAVRAGPPNFAGHYIFVSWGCGSPCQMSAIVDAKTGKVYEGLGSGVGFDIRKNSKLVIVNPPDSEGYYENNWWNIPELHVWKDGKFELLQRAGDTPTLSNK